MLSYIEYSDFSYLLEKEGWVREVSDVAEAESLVSQKKESVSQFSIWYTDPEWGEDLWELEVKMTLKDGSFLYALSADIDPRSNRACYSRLSCMFGSSPRKRNKRAFKVPLGITASSLSS